MAKRAKRHYHVRWAVAGHPPIADVTITATNDNAALRTADRLAVQMRTMNTPRTVYVDGRLVESNARGTR